MQKPYPIKRLSTPKDVADLDNLLAMLFAAVGRQEVASDGVSTFLTLKSPDGTVWFLAVDNSGVASWQNTRP